MYLIGLSRDASDPYHNQPTATVTSAERLYYCSLSSPYTQGCYRTYLQKYLAQYGMKNVTEFLSKSHKEIEGQIIEREGNEAHCHIELYLSLSPSFCKINDIMLNTMKINKFMHDRE